MQSSRELIDGDNEHLSIPNITSLIPQKIL